MATKKTIQINPELFNISGNKTKKKREKMNISLNPIVSPNNLKNKLLKRIKEHKTKELNDSVSSDITNTKPDNTYTDEFYGAIDYLSGLKQKQTQQQNLKNKTLKNQQSSMSLCNPPILLDLPPELVEYTKPMITSDIFNVNYKNNDDVPYGCLKNGKKKTYREWKEYSSPSIYPKIQDLVRPPTPPKKNNGIFLTNLKDKNQTTEINNTETSNSIISREDRLEQIKNKLKKLEDKDTSLKRRTIEDFNKIEKEINKPYENKLLSDLPDIEDDKGYLPNITEMLQQREETIEKQNPKQYLKKTIKRKFTLGKSDKLRRIAVLIKDRQTRKNIINTQKELKKTDINTVRKYLRQHGIIKVGSTCPSDILRKTFESAVLAGEITNTNKETLLYNFLHED